MLLAAHILSMLGFSTFAALLPELRDLWRLSNSQAGVIGGMFFAGYIATVSYWTALTDRHDGRKVYLAGSLLAAAGSAGFGLLAEGFASAVLFQLLLGVGIAATYMPGLRLLSDRISGPSQSRYIAFYTSFFGIGTALSLAIAGFVTPLAGWRMAFLLCALGPLLAGVLVFAFVEPSRRAPSAGRAFSLKTLFPLHAWRRVMANRAAAGYTLGYTAHCLELFGSRAWMVALLAFSSGFHANETFPWQLAAIAAVVNLVSVPASIFGNEIALRIGRRRWILIAMAGSGSSGILLGLSAPSHWAIVLGLLVIYSMLVMAESATLTAGLVAAAPVALRGAAMGLYSLAGFAGGMLGPVVFGATLDIAGGAGNVSAWAFAYAAIGAGCLAAPLMAWSARIGKTPL
ncbi:MAG TPA: MFS transporter [Burkholderiales bacterium]|nr:MFS transporter [Burkholderiales bacterium]